MSEECHYELACQISKPFRFESQDAHKQTHTADRVLYTATKMIANDGDV